MNCGKYLVELRCLRRGVNRTLATVFHPPAMDSARSGAAQELRALLDAAVDAVVVIDGAGRVETFNRAAEQMFGFGAAEEQRRHRCAAQPGTR